jgi:glutathione peroxidase
MKIALAVAILALLPLGSGAEEPQSLFEFETHTLLGEEVSLDQYAGRVCLVVNVASKCGLTPQYEGLQALYTELGGDDFTILAFPSNDFMDQEPGSPEEIASFCDKEYGVTFPMFEKVHVKGDEKSPIYEFLSADLEEPTWNFTKYLVGRDGKVLHRFDPRTKPEDPQLRKRIEDAIAN